MSTGKIGAVVVGTGFGLFTHTRALQEAGFEVKAIIGRDLKKTQERAAPLGLKGADNLVETLKDESIKLVTVATPPHTHYKPVMEAIAAEAQNHPVPKGKPGRAWKAAARALAPVDLAIGQWKNLVLARRSYARLAKSDRFLVVRNSGPKQSVAFFRKARPPPRFLASLLPK